MLYFRNCSVNICNICNRFEIATSLFINKMNDTRNHKLTIHQQRKQAHCRQNDMNHFVEILYLQGSMNIYVLIMVINYY